MVYPSKQEQVYRTLCREFREKFHPGAKLPPEREYALQLGVARRTLRSVLKRLAQENRLVRNTHGTFLRDEQIRYCEHTEQKEPVTILLPCPDYLQTAGHSSCYALTQMILGAMRAAIEYSTHVVTIPVSETNSPDDINWHQLQHLNKYSNVIFSGSWFQKIFPLLAERRCRVGCLDLPENSCISSLPDMTYINYQNASLADFWTDAVRQLHADGAERIVYFGSSAALISQFRPAFRKAVLDCGLTPDDSQFQVYDEKIPLRQRLALLRKLYRTMAFDGLILELNPYKEHDYEFDLYDETGIPLSTRIITTVSDLLHQPRVAEHAKVCHYPYMRICRDMTKFLLSGQTGQHVRHVCTIFQNAGDFIMETRYK